MKQVGLAFALIFLMLSIGFAWQVELTVEPTVGLSIDQDNFSLGTLGANAQTVYVHVTNDGNVPLQVSVAPIGTGEATASMSVDDWKDGSCKGRAAEAVMSKDPVVICKELNFSHSADEIRLSVRLAQNDSGDVRPGKYRTALNIIGQSEYGNTSKEVDIDYAIAEKPKAKVIAPETAIAGVPSQVLVTGSDAKPLANIVVEVREGEKTTATLITNDLGEAQFDSKDEGNYTYAVKGYTTEAAMTSIHKPNAIEQASAAVYGTGKAFLANPIFAIVLILGLLFLVSATLTLFILRKGRKPE